jgi:predicted site-specific integrase-resolvase
MNTLHSVPTVAKKAGVTRQTIYNWMNAGMITWKHSVDGRPVFDKQETETIVAIAKRRKSLIKQWKFRI